MALALRRYRLEALWVSLAVANYAARLVWPSWETIPLHLAWLGLTLVCALRVWPVRPTRMAIAGLVALAVASLAVDAFGVQLWNEVLEVPPLMAMLLLTFVWRGRRQVEAHRIAERRAERRTETLERQRRFMHDASHDLRAPVTIARGHLELALGDGGDRRDVEVALDELARIDAIIERLLLLATVDQPDFLVRRELELEPFMEEVLIRWSGVAPRAWRLGPLAAGRLVVDRERLLVAIDALLENAVKYSDPGSVIELRALPVGPSAVSIEIEDEGVGVPEAELERIFDRFARADPSGSRPGAGLGLAIVDAIARRHGGSCTAATTAAGSTFAIQLPEFRPTEPPQLVPALSSASR